MQTKTITNIEEEVPASFEGMVIPSLPIQQIGSFIESIESFKDKASYASTCKAVYGFFKPELDEIRLKDLLDAIVNDGKMQIFFDDKKIAKEILDKHPHLVLQKPRKSTVIEKIISCSQGTQKFHTNEAPLTNALILGNIGMVKLLLPYFYQNQDGKFEALAQWKLPGSEEKIKQYSEMIKKLILTISQETFKVPIEQTEALKMVNQFIKKLNSDVHISLENYFDPIGLLIAGYEADCKQLNSVQKQKVYSYFLSIVKNSLPQECREFFIKRGAVQTANEVFNNRSLCNEFFRYIQLRSKHLEKIYNGLKVDCALDFVQASNKLTSAINNSIS